MRRLPLRTETMLVLACAGAAGLLAASEFMTTFEFTPPGGEALQASDAADRHSYGMLVLAVFALIALTVALVTGAKPAAIAVAVAGGIALLIFLIGDLPDANKVGTLDDPRESFIDAKAEPQLGFWLELVGALVLTVGGGALATLRPDQLAIASRWRGGPGMRSGSLGPERESRAGSDSGARADSDASRTSSAAAGAANLSRGGKPPL